MIIIIYVYTPIILRKPEKFKAQEDYKHALLFITKLVTSFFKFRRKSNFCSLTHFNKGKVNNDFYSTILLNSGLQDDI